MPALKQVVEQNDTPHGRLFDLFIQALILLSMISFAIETIPDLGDSAQRWLDVFEVFCVVVFSIEYGLRVISVPAGLVASALAKARQLEDDAK